MAWPANSIIAKLFGRARLEWYAGFLAGGVACALPWSTSLTSIIIAAWLVTLIGSWQVAALRREISTPAGGIPVAFWALGVVGVLWAIAPLGERMSSLSSFHK